MVSVPPSSAMVAESSCAAGTSLTPLTVTVKLSETVSPPLSVAVISMVATPFWSKARSRVSVSPLRSTDVNNVGLLFPDTLSVSASPLVAMSTSSNTPARSTTTSGPSSKVLTSAIGAATNGASLTGVTVMVNVATGEVSSPPPLSCSSSSMVAEPLAFSADVKLRSPLLASTAGWVVNSAGLLLLTTLKVSVWPASSAGPAEMAVAQPAMTCGPASSSTVGSAPRTKLGGSLTSPRVMVNDTGADVSTPPSAVPPSSVSVTVTSAVPTASGAVVKVRSPDSASTAGATAKMPGLLSTVTTKVGVCPASLAGPTLMALAQPISVTAPASSSTETLPTAVKLGASLTGVTVIVNVSVGDVSSPPPLSCSSSSMVALPNASAAGV
jgi:hypothetical protein